MLFLSFSGSQLLIMKQMTKMKCQLTLKKCYQILKLILGTGGGQQNTNNGLGMASTGAKMTPNRAKPSSTKRQCGTESQVTDVN